MDRVLALLRALNEAQYTSSFTLFLYDGEAISCRRVAHMDEGDSNRRVVVVDVHGVFRTLKLKDITEVRIA